MEESDYKIPHLTILIDEMDKPNSPEEARKNWESLIEALRMGPQIVERVFNKLLENERK